MAVGADPRICLSFLYQNDPFYSLCLSDLLSAPQRVKNKFLKEQKNLAVTVKKLEHQKQSRLRQLNEEEKQFRLHMLKKLAPRVTVSRGSSIGIERLSNIPFSSLASSKSSWKNQDIKYSDKPNTGFFSTASHELPATHTPKFCKATDSYSPGVVAANIYKHLQNKKQLIKSERKENVWPIFMNEAIKLLLGCFKWQQNAGEHLKLLRRKKRLAGFTASAQDVAV
ncbi:uncharacterized protein LOC134410797 [Elgaria multicarinata webbii]|uniref:uncharacterized protein LOC134410797 n=1 Tax=Elgaria multicarinata webbii TaxID=159646 RepID=UPI002FCCEC83